MNVLLVAIGSHGDVHPFVGIGQALRGRGHQVTILTNGMFEPLVRGAGFGFVPFGTAEEYRQTALNPDLWHPLKGFKLVAEFGILRSARPVYEAVAEFWNTRPRGETVVVASSLGLGARLAQEKLGVPVATVHLSPVVFRSLYESPKFPGMFMPRWLPKPLKRLQYALADRVVIRPFVTKPLNAVRAECGLPPERDLFGDYIHSPQRVIGLFPDWYAPPQPDWPPQTRLTNFPLYDERDVEPLTAEVSRFLDAGEPPIAFTPGSAMWQGHGFLAESAEACRLLGRRGILLTRHRDHLPPRLPPGVIHAAYAPFSQLLPRCAALVHHGGIGTLSQGLAAGVPHVVMPMAHDQADNAARLRRLGVAAVVPPKRYKARRVARELGELLENAAVRENCRTVAERLRGRDGLEETCELIEELAGKSAAVP